MVDNDSGYDPAETPGTLYRLDPDGSLYEMVATSWNWPSNVDKGNFPANILSHRDDSICCHAKIFLVGLSSMVLLSGDETTPTLRQVVPEDGIISVISFSQAWWCCSRRGGLFMVGLVGWRRSFPLQSYLSPSLPISGKKKKKSASHLVVTFSQKFLFLHYGRPRRPFSATTMMRWDRCVKELSETRFV